ncbi:MAG: glycosyltransferase family 4 protein [Proteobacteria bacterium]|nr:glycosyltransferase family 4 protein [Pseudomonadota bacterium]MBU1570523.1 glycosyltransferase family 4 protein [Pseudomonadota bacterium]
MIQGISGSGGPVKERYRLAFCLFEYITFGGMQRDLLRIARTCMSRGHQVNLFCSAWKGEIPDDINVSLLAGQGLANHLRCKSFVKKVLKHLDTDKYDAVIGFNKMPGLDLYFAADSCFAAKARERGFLYRLTGRCRTYSELERAVFEKDSNTEILLISEREKGSFIEFYGTDENRFHLLPPGIDKNRLATTDAPEIRAALRTELSIGENENIILFIGSGFKTKGLDRAITALSSLQPALLKKTVLLVLGEDKAKPFLGLARQLGIQDKVRFMGGRFDVPRFLMAADLLLHPAYRENTGTVLIEAMAAGLPVLASDVCGYGYHVRNGGAGELISSPFEQEKLNHLLSYMLTTEKRAEWQECGRNYISGTDVFSLPEKAADIIEAAARLKKTQGKDLNLDSL